MFFKKAGIVLTVLTVAALAFPTTSEAGWRRRCCCQASYSGGNYGYVATAGYNSPQFSCGCNAGSQPMQNSNSSQAPSTPMNPNSSQPSSNNNSPPAAP